MKAIVTLLAALTPTLAIAASTYRVTDLGDLPGGLDFSEAVDLNDNGEVVGSSRTADDNAHGFLWNQSSGIEDLGEFFPAGINDSTQIAGSAVFGTIHAALWDPVNGVQDLGDLPGGDDSSNGRDVNNAGQVVGFSSASGANDHAFLWTSANGMQDLNTLIGTDGFSAAAAINNSGQVVGESTAESGGSHAFLWDSANGMQDMGKLPGGANDTSRADDINDAGVVVGYSAAANFAERAFIWDSVNGMRSLGKLPGGQNFSFAFGINNSDHIVGVSGSSSGSRAVLWTGSSIIDLNDVLDPDDPLAPFVTLTDAQAINDAGQIAATGTDSRTGATRAYLLTPVAANILLDLASLTDVNGNATADVAVLVGELPTPAPARSIDLTSGAKVVVRDGGSGDPISEMTILDADWQAIDLVVTPGGTGALIGVLSQRNDGAIAVAVHRARDGASVREIPYFGPRSEPSAVAYVPNATGPGGSAFAVIAKNMDDERVSVQLRRRSDGGLINTNRFFLAGWDALELLTIDDVSGNNRPELVVLARSDAGLNQVIVKDAETKANVNKINYFAAATTPKAAAVLGDIGGGAAPEVAVLGQLPDGRYSAQNRDTLTDERVTSVSFFGPNWSAIGFESLADVNGNGSGDLAMLAQHETDQAIRVQVRDALTGNLIRTVTFLDPTWSPRAIAAFADIDGNGVQEIGVAACLDNGDVRVQLRDAATGDLVRTIDIP